MRLESALITGREGISAHGQAISVVGDNIANTNTNGFKVSRAEFADMLSSGPGGRETTTISGVGTGVSVSRVRPIFEGGMIEATGRILDVGVDGEGFLMVGDAANPFYTRAGNLSVDPAGNLVNGEGKSVLGLAPGSTALSAISVNNVSLTGAATSKSTMIGNLEASLPTQAVPTNPTSFRDLKASYTSNLGVYDSLGQAHTISVAFFKTGSNAWTAQAYIDGGEVGKTAGTPVQIGSDLKLEFTSTGAIDPAKQAAAVITGNPAYGNGAAAGNFTIDLSKFTQYAMPSNLAGVSQDGLAAGNIKNYEIRPNGELYANLDSGTYQLIGTIQLADFVNQDGLQRAGSTLFRATDQVGTRTTGNPGTGSLGKLQSGALERSTVDISKEFVDLVVLQRGYQANSQSLQTAAQLIRDTIQLMR